MNKKILMSIMAIGLVAMLAGTGLYAVFTSTDTSGPHTFTAGTLIITAGGATWKAGINSQNLKPGDTLTLEIPVTNGGTLPLDYTITWVIGGALSTGSTPCVVSQIRVDGVVTASDSLGVGGSDNVQIDITMPSGAGNAYQGLSGTITVTFNAEQQ